MPWGLLNRVICPKWLRVSCWSRDLQGPFQLFCYSAAPCSGVSGHQIRCGLIQCTMGLCSGWKLYRTSVWPRETQEASTGLISVWITSWHAELQFPILYLKRLLSHKHHCWLRLNHQAQRWVSVSPMYNKACTAASRNNSLPLDQGCSSGETDEAKHAVQLFV